MRLAIFTVKTAVVCVCVCVSVLQDAGTLTGEAEVGASPSIQSLSAIQAGPGGPHSRKNSERDVSSSII